MASKEHKQSATIIKNIHAKLREEYRLFGNEIAWKRHVDEINLLKEYAVTMKNLSHHWNERDSNPQYGTFSRYKWIKEQCIDYFHDDGMRKFDMKEKKMKMQLNLSNKMENSRVQVELMKNTRIDLLDVGSCYNPLKNEEAFNVTAIDLIATPDNVWKCDFLNVKLGKEKILSSEEQEICQLSENSYDAIVFSLLLEYLPCPEQRYICCQKAFSLLRSAGILLIISPDSNHMGVNAELMKSWKYVLSKLGFLRIKYVKLRHIHCLVFRKCIHIEVALRSSNFQLHSEDNSSLKVEKKIYIPQDFNNFNLIDLEKKEFKYEVDDLIRTFHELPFSEC